MKLSICCLLLALSFSPFTSSAQTSSSTLAAPSAATDIPKLVKFSGTVTVETGKPISGVVGVTFSLYKDQQGGAPLWLETQNVQADANGRYTVLLGSTKSDGLPTALFNSEQARWVGVQVGGQAEQRRVLLSSVPYAFKAGDAETIGGLPPSAFVMVDPAQPKKGISTTSPTLPKVAMGQAPPPNPAVTGKGTIGYVPVWDTTSDIVNSVVFQKNSAIGIGTTAPAATLDVNGKSDMRDTLTLYPKGTDSTVAINGTSFKVDKSGKVTFVSGQTFPGAGTVTKVGSGAGLIGGPITKAGTLSIATGGVSNAMLANPALTVKAGTDLTGGGSVALGGSTTLDLDTAKVPQLDASNTFTGDQAVTGNLSATGMISSTSATFAGGSGVALQASNSTGTVGMATPTFLINAFTSGGGVFNVDPSGNGFYKGSISAQGVSVSGAGPSVVFGSATGSSGVNFGVQGITASVSGVGVQGVGPGNGVSGFSSADGTGVIGTASGTSGLNFGVQGITVSSGGIGVQARNDATGGFVALAGPSLLINAFVNTTGMFTVDDSGNGFYAGDLNVTGNLSKGGGMFKIDHPLDPANKYLSHSFVESPDMMNIYNGLVTLDAHGSAWIIMPDYFEALNRDFRYQLTPVGRPQPSLYIGKELAGNRFKIAGGKPGGRVSWQLTGVRHDAYANAYRIPTEEDKPAAEHGYYLHPEVFGQPASKRIQVASRKASASDQLARVSNP
jgi:hypothetical protein